jgi:CRISPR system Cascade subunit CasB
MMGSDSTSPPVPAQSPSLGAFVGRRISDLQRRYLSPAERASAAGTLASLRHAAAKPVGEDLDTWLIEFAGFPEELQGRGDQPSPSERAAHLAFTLYAIHQQSQSTGMHQSGREYGLGRAVARLDGLQRASGVSDPPGKLPTRFAALGTATTFEEVGHYARQLITQLRGVGIPLDYGRLAEELARLQSPARAHTVRLTWGRDFANFRPDSSSPTTDPKEQ